MAWILKKSRDARYMQTKSWGEINAIYYKQIQCFALSSLFKEYVETVHIKGLYRESLRYPGKVVSLISMPDGSDIQSWIRDNAPGKVKIELAVPAKLVSSTNTSCELSISFTDPGIAVLTKLAFGGAQ